ncbi:MAG: Cys-tRNA(Pro) deacylase [Treponema sp.]|nr:Cys-tRNA(Pro) deacylase [Treponema sp.]
MKKTNAMRILDGLKIKYEVLSYDDDGEHELARGAAEKTAEKLGIPTECVYKTIVMRSESKQIFVFCQCALHEINLKKARTACGAKEISPVKPEELLALTGYVRGGCSPLGMKKKFPTFIDESAFLHEKIYISAGMRGEQIALSPADLVKATDAAACDLVLETA